jgi:D-inositol-3-phosphate glycosyltransferase
MKSLRTVPARPPRRVAMLTAHTSPLDQPGVGDAGGMNVYVVELAKRLARAGTAVEIFTRATTGSLETTVELAPGVLVRHLVAGPFEGLRKDELPGQLCAMTSGLMRWEAAHDPGHYDLIHSHYWLSGQIGWLASERWNVPLVHSMHTMAKVKNAALAEGDQPEPRAREYGEEQVVDIAHRLVANTVFEADQLIRLYGADRERVAVVHPGVDLDTFTPGNQAEARIRLGLPAEADVLLFAGRIQPLKAPDVLLRAAAILAADPERRERLVVAIVGGPSGSGLDHPDAVQQLSRDLGIADLVRFEPPTDQATLVDWYRAATLTVVPSYNESFGLVAVESQACGTPVVAAAVGGLHTAVADGESGVLVEGHEPADWSTAIASLLDSPAELDRLAAGALRHAADFGWERTAAATLDVYSAAMLEHAGSGPVAASG